MSGSRFPDVCSFISACPTPWHTVEFMATLLESAGFSKRDLDTRFTVKHGDSFFLTSGGHLSTFQLPKEEIRRVLFFASHTDSPTFKVKHNPAISNQSMHSLLVESYGGPKLNTWLDRDLYIAGQVFSKSRGKIRRDLVRLDSHLFTIPSLAIHLDREDAAHLKKQTHLRPLFSIDEKVDLTSLLMKATGSETILSSDLFLAAHEMPRILQNSLLSGWRIDNLASAHAMLHTLVQHRFESDHTLVCHIFFNHEEIGSGTSEGAEGPLFQRMLEKIAYELMDSPFIPLEWLSTSLGVSIDMAHAYHPNYGEKYDKENAPLLGKGVALKHNANAKYATTARGVACLMDVAQRAELPLQHYTSHSDTPCGSTVGHILSHKIGMEVVDIGIPQLAMHSARELCSSTDQEQAHTLLIALVEAMK